MCLTQTFPLVVVAAALAACDPALVSSASDPLTLSAIGCPMAHCDPQMSDRDSMAPPIAIGHHWHDTTVSGAWLGLGCSSNGTLAACTLLGGGQTPSLVVYGADGSHVWTNSGFDSLVTASAPIIDADGGVIATDANVIARFDSLGTMLWQTPVPGGLPISPVPVPGDLVFLGTGARNNAAPLHLYDATTGTRIASQSVPEVGDPSGEYYYATANTPAVVGARAYLVMERKLTNGSTDPAPVGRLIAFDLSAAGIVEAWRSEPFGAPSGASPLAIGNRIIFDGAGATPGEPANKDTGYFFGVDDNGTTSTRAWTASIGGPSQASAAQDPRGGFWVWAVQHTALIHLDLDGHRQPDSIADLGTMVPGPPRTTTPRSAVSMTGPSDAAVMILSLGQGLANNVCALALGANVGAPVTPRWCFSSGVIAAGQFPIVSDASGHPVVVFASGFDGVYGLSN